VSRATSADCRQVRRESASVYPNAFRRVTYLDAETEKRFKFLTNNFTLPAHVIAQIYKCRWHRSNMAIPNEFCRKAKAKALEALQRDSEAAEPHTILADEECFCELQRSCAETASHAGQIHQDSRFLSDEI